MAAPKVSSPDLLWSYALPAPPAGMSLAREKNWLLLWDANNGIHLLNQLGKLQAKSQHPAPIAAACCADDGSSLAIAGADSITWLAPDLQPRWDQSFPGKIVALATDPFGQYLAVADVKGALRVLDKHGRMVSQMDCPRPLHHLAFIPAAGYIVGCADFGVVACVDLKGRWVWREGMVSHVGGLAVSGDGDSILLACFSEGVLRYQLQGKKLPAVPTPEPCRLVSSSFAGERLLCAGLSERLHLLDQAGGLLASYSLEAPAVAIALGALGRLAYAALRDGRVVGMDCKKVTLTAQQ